MKLHKPFTTELPKDNKAVFEIDEGGTETTLINNDPWKSAFDVPSENTRDIDYQPIDFWGERCK